MCPLLVLPCPLNTTQDGRQLCFLTLVDEHNRRSLAVEVRRSFKGTLRRERLNRELFATLAETKVLTETWQRYYNTQRFHTTLGYQTPQQYYEENQAAEHGPLGALPPTPQGLSLATDPQETKAKGAQKKSTPLSCVFGPTTALGSLPSVALILRTGNNHHTMFH